MRFTTTTIKGHGRGKFLGFPTINMIIPESLTFSMKHGVYAARAKVKDEKYIGALYYGPAPVFKEKQAALEIYLIDTTNFYMNHDEEIEIEAVKFIRGVEDFGLPELLVEQMKKDVEQIREILKK